jgi:uncharacterized protein with PIN domain
MSLNNDIILQLSIFSSERTMKLLESIKLEIRETQKWIYDLIHQTKQESKIKKERCEICNSKEEACGLELHHLSGRKHDYRTITVCLVCHRWLSDKQKTWDKRWLDEKSEHLRQAFFLLGLQNILELKTIKTGNSTYAKLAYSYNEKISVLLGSW